MAKPWEMSSTRQTAWTGPETPAASRPRSPGARLHRVSILGNGRNGIRLPRSGSQLTFPVWLREGGWWGLEKPDCLAFVFLAALSVREDALPLRDLSEETLGFAGRQTLGLLSGMSLVP